MIWIKNFKYEIKAMGIVFFIPIIMFLIVSIYIILLKYNNQKDFLASDTIQIFIPVFGCWWSTFYLSNVFEKKKGEVLLTLPISIIKISLLQSSKYLLINLISIGIIFFVFAINYDAANYLDLLLFICQSTFYFSMAYILIACLKNSSWTIFISFSYLFIQFLTKGQLLSAYNIHNFNNFEGAQIQLSIKAIIFSIILLIIGQLVINRKHKLKG